MVTVAHKGHDVHGILRMEIERAVIQISQHSKGEGEALEWLKDFVDVMEWLDGRVVSFAWRRRLTDKLMKPCFIHLEPLTFGFG